jgi:transcriptional regulator with PAS, ATPase and Fis domain
MLELISNKVWELLKKRDVSFAMIFDIDGNILWHRGREITGGTIADGSGFSKTSIKEALVKGKIHKQKWVTVTENGNNTTGSILLLFMGRLIKIQISYDYFLYIDSDSAASFSRTDCEIFMVLGEILGDTIRHIQKKEKNIRGIAGTSEAIEEIRKLIGTYAKVDEPLLITGETGTGKTYIAELIHNLSQRKGNFIVINTPGIPESLFESELFGHKKGAFTNAAYDKKGLVEEAAEGTLLIDEVTEVSFALQAKLLRFIETGKYTRLGECFEREADVRIIAAANKDLHDAIEKKEFREDLYYRLSVFEIEMPPLKKRKEDLRALVMEKIKYLNNKEMGKGFWEAIYYHDWPGNVRELISVLKRTGLLDKDIITGKDIEAVINGNSRNRKVKAAKDGSKQIWNEIKSGKSFWEVVKEPYMSRELKRSEVKAVIDRGLVVSNGRYNELIKTFNLKKNDYHRLMRFLYDQDFIPQKKVTG